MLRDSGGMTTRTVDRLLQVFLGLTLAQVAIGAVFGLVFIGQDAGESGEFLDGLGTLVGLAILALVGVPGVVAAVALSRSLRGRPNAANLALVASVLGICSTSVFVFAYQPLVAALVPVVLVFFVALHARRTV